MKFNWWQKLTLLQKLAVVLVVIAAIIIVAMLFGIDIVSSYIHANTTK